MSTHNQAVTQMVADLTAITEAFVNWAHTEDFAAMDRPTALRAVIEGYSVAEHSFERLANRLSDRARKSGDYDVLVHIGSLYAVLTSTHDEIIQEILNHDQ